MPLLNSGFTPQKVKHMASSDQKQSPAIERILVEATAEERNALTHWTKTLLDIRESKLPAYQKAIDSLRATSRAGVALPIVKTIGKMVMPDAVTTLVETLISIKADSSLGKGDKLSKAMKIGFQSLKAAAWEDRGLVARAGIASAVVAAVLFGSQGAGIAALGTAIGVPLWVVFGAGGAFVAALYKELTGKKHVPEDPKKTDLTKPD